MRDSKADISRPFQHVQRTSALAYAHCTAPVSVLILRTLNPFEILASWSPSQVYRATGSVLVRPRVPCVFFPFCAARLPPSVFLPVRFFRKAVQACPAAQAARHPASSSSRVSARPNRGRYTRCRSSRRCCHPSARQSRRMSFRRSAALRAYTFVLTTATVSS